MQLPKEKQANQGLCYKDAREMLRLEEKGFKENETS